MKHSKNYIITSRQQEVIREYIENNLKTRVKSAEKETNTKPTEKEKEAKNYKKGKVNINGFRIAIEQPKGSIRKGVDKKGNPWEVKMNNTYGYFITTTNGLNPGLGKDGDSIDVFLGEKYNSKKIFVIDQFLNGEFDESKVFLLVDNKEEAEKEYLKNYEKGWKGLKYITEVDEETFKTWLYDKKRQRKPFAQYEGVKKNRLEESLFYDYDYDDIEYNTAIANVLYSFRENPNQKQKWEFINAQQYQKAIIDFVTNGEFVRFPTNIIDKWVGMIYRNIMQLYANTQLAGHSQWFPYEEVQEVFEETEDLKKNYNNFFDFLDNLGLYDTMVTPDGRDAWSDYGLPQLMDLLKELIDEEDYKQKFVIINKILDVVHQRSDIAAIFIQGGSSTLSKLRYTGDKHYHDSVEESLSYYHVTDASPESDEYQIMKENKKDRNFIINSQQFELFESNNKKIVNERIYYNFQEIFNTLKKGVKSGIKNKSILNKLSPYHLLIGQNTKNGYSIYFLIPKLNLKIRISDHRISNMNRLINEIQFELSEENLVNKIVQVIDKRTENLPRKVEENIELEVNANQINLKSFEEKDGLNDKLFTNEKLNSKVRLKLLDIADSFVDFLDIPWAKPKDVVLVGSIVGYNWSKYSDIDLHIIYNFNDVIGDKRGLLRNFFDSKKNEWKERTKGLTIYGYDVELYVEDEKEPATSNGRYSLETNQWIQFPSRENTKEFDKAYVKEKSAKIMTLIDDMEDIFHSTKDTAVLSKLVDEVNNLWRKLKGMRKEGIAKSGESSIYNIIFKVLRRAEYLQKLHNLKEKLYVYNNSIH